jgi:hypothetical protein
MTRVAQVIGLPVADRGERTLANSGLALARRSGDRRQGSMCDREATGRIPWVTPDTAGALARDQQRRAMRTEWHRGRGGLLPAIGAAPRPHVARVQPALPGCDGSAILPLPERRDWVMLTQPVYGTSAPVADVRLPARTFLDGRARRSPPKPRLLDRVRAALRARHYSRRTEEAYVAWIKRDIFFFHAQRHPAEMELPRSPASSPRWRSTAGWPP